jgi:hypothetical protein
MKRRYTSYYGINLSIFPANSTAQRRRRRNIIRVTPLAMRLLFLHLLLSPSSGVAFISRKKLIKIPLFFQFPPIGQQTFANLYGEGRGGEEEKPKEMLLL